MLNILINDLADHPESIIYKFMNDAKLRQETCTMNERTRIHRDTDKLEKQTHRSLMIFNKEKANLYRYSVTLHIKKGEQQPC